MGLGAFAANSLGPAIGGEVVVLEAVVALSGVALGFLGGQEAALDADLAVYHIVGGLWAEAVDDDGGVCLGVFEFRCEPFNAVNVVRVSNEVLIGAKERLKVLPFLVREVLGG